MANPSGAGQPGNSSGSATSLENAPQVLRDYLALCLELLGVVERENQALRSKDTFDPAAFQQARNSLLPRLEQAYKNLKEVRISWHQLSEAQRQQHAEVAPLLRQAQDVTMKFLLMDRENEQAMLRRGLLPATQLPSANRQRPNFVSELYRRGGAS